MCIFHISLQCCDHPYLLDQSLQGLVTKGLSMEENLNFGVKVSGKLQILDKILLETKVRGLRVLILFQVGSAHKANQLSFQFHT